MKQHSMSCEYPEGCSCGASEWNQLEHKFILLREENERLSKNLDCATKGLWSAWELERAKYKAMELGGLFEHANAELADHLLKQNVKLKGQLDAILGFSEPWNLYETLKKLCEATEHLKTAHMCDGDGHEQYWIALEKGREYIETIQKTLK